jgi:murein tripeptide amidase MpaA
LEQLSLAFPNNVILEEIGLTAENRSIYSVVLTKDKNLENFDTLPIMLFTGLHHAREPLSFTMNLYLILKIMYDSIRGDPNIMEILNGSKFVFVPALNIDGYAEILEIYNRTMVLTEIIRKNRRKTDDCPKYD